MKGREMEEHETGDVGEILRREEAGREGGRRNIRGEG